MKNLILGMALVCFPALGTVEDAHAGLLARHVYVADQDQYGLADKWAMSLIGDCEDFALFSYFYLSGKGYAPEFWLVRTAAGEMHAAIVVDGYVFDNLGLVLQDQSDYKFIVQVQRDALRRALKK